MKRYLVAIFIFLIAAYADSAEIKVKQSALTPRNAIWYSEPLVTKNTRTGDSFVYWYREPTGSSPDLVVGRFLDAKGVPLTKELKLPGNDQPIGFAGVRVAYNSITNEYLAAYVGPYNNFVSEFGIYTQRLTEKGIPIGTPTLITNDPEIAQWELAVLHLLFNPKNGGYTVLVGVHRVNDIAGDSSSIGIVLTDKGIPVGPLKTLKVAASSSSHASYFPSGDKLLYIWRYVYHGNKEADLWLKSFDPFLDNTDASNFGTKINSVPLIVEDHLGAVMASVVAFPTEEVGVIYYPDSTNTKGRRINIQGKFSGAPFVAFNRPKANTKLQLPSAAFAMTQKGVRGILIGLQGSLHDGNSLWAQVIDQTGKPIGSPVEVLKKSENEAVILGNLQVMPSNPTDTSFRFVWFGTIGQKDRFGHFQTGRILKLTLDLTP